jgi:hypothetical protein
MKRLHLHARTLVDVLPDCNLPFARPPAAFFILTFARILLVSHLTLSKLPANPAILTEMDFSEFIVSRPANDESRIR